MKFSCERCQTRYSIGDDKVKGKVLKIRCKTCGNIIVVREQMPTVQGEASGYAVPQQREAFAAASGGSGAAVAQPRAETGPSLSSSSPPQQAQQQRAPAGPPRELEWYVAIKGKQHGPAGREDIGRLFREGKISDRTYLWHDQLPSWTRLKDLAEFAPLLAEAPAPRRPPPPPPSDDGAEIVNFEAARAQRQGQQQQQQQQLHQQQQAPGAVLNDPFAAIGGAPGIGGDNAPRESTRVFIMQAGLHNRGKKQRIYAGVAVLGTLGFILLCVIDYQLDIFGLKQALDAVAVSTGIKDDPFEAPGAGWDDGEGDPTLKCQLMPNPDECVKKEKARRAQRKKQVASGGAAVSDADLKGAFGGAGEAGGKIEARGGGIDDNGMFVGTGGASAEEIKKALGGGKAGPSGPRARIETPSVAGTTIDADNATRVVRDGQAGIQICVDDAMKKNEDIPAKLRMTLSVGLKGTVEKAVINDGVVNASGVGSCITKTARKWKFAPPTEPADLEIPLVLR